MHGRLLAPLDLARRLSRAAALAAAVLFASSLALLALGLPGPALALWLAAGASAGTVSYLSSSYVYRLAGILLERAGEAEEPAPRPLFDPLTGALATIVAPPAAALVAKGSIEWLGQLLDWVLQAMPEAQQVVEKEAPIAPVSPGLYAAAATVVGLPLLVEPLWRLLGGLACLSLRVLAARDPMLRDKPCTGDLIEIVVWSKPLYDALNSKLFSEKWSIKD